MPTKSDQMMKYKPILCLLLTGTVTYSRRANIAFTMAFRDFEFLFLHKRAHFTQVKNPTRISTITPPTMDVRIRPRYSSPDYRLQSNQHIGILSHHIVSQLTPLDHQHDPYLPMTQQAFKLQAKFRLIHTFSSVIFSAAIRFLKMVFCRGTRGTSKMQFSGQADRARSQFSVFLVKTQTLGLLALLHATRY